jgi:cytochrome P450
MHDEAHFEGPMKFRPERYLTNGMLNPDTLDPEVAAFGYGRRKCPGRHLSTESLTFMAASLLAVFNINPASDAQGNPIPVRLETGPGFIV